MGTLLYGSLSFPFDDRTLVHLQIAIGAKLRRGEGFFFSWNAIGAGTERGSIWLSHTVPLAFAFDNSKVGPIDAAWLHDLEAQSSNGPSLTLTADLVRELAGEGVRSR
ncbi:hypothetical protein GCM10025867_11260 [Frondihabitans sucicola]|uniref:DUF7882 domain-containing protein n=1 Tax=Frondihabitans sucicola TaxID=1268041 RepID=A0ABM8GKG7_9MICO|nr:ATP-dependent DNA ligase [Frondihabitans sucicola]BDZ48885.1 hypothetical protein GCM10025867_11260 [Frondihabitans sucicola]